LHHELGDVRTPDVAQWQRLELFFHLNRCPLEGLMLEILIDIDVLGSDRHCLMVSIPGAILDSNVDFHLRALDAHAKVREACARSLHSKVSILLSILSQSSLTAHASA